MKINISQTGIALLIVLWVMMILTAMVFSFAAMTRSDSFGTLALKEGTEKRLLAEAGIERGIMEMIYRSLNKNRTAPLPGQESWKPDGRLYTVDMAEKYRYAVRLADESGKISLNGLTDAGGIILKNLLISQHVSPGDADVIADSILDWKDADDLHRLNGTENAYYLALPKPYNARNAKFETVEELILVRGVTPDILYGTTERKGIIHFLTVHTNTGQVNIETAPKEILAALPGMDTALLERIIAIRDSSDIFNAAVIKEIAGAAYPLMAPFVNAGQGAAVYAIEATGYKDDLKKGYSILAKITFDSSRQYRYVYYKSPMETLR